MSAVDAPARRWVPLDGHAWLRVDVGADGPAFHCARCDTFVGFREAVEPALALRALSAIAAEHVPCGAATSPGGTT
jgi:hypothetical protein